MKPPRDMPGDLPNNYDQKYPDLPLVARAEIQGDKILLISLFQRILLLVLILLPGASMVNFISRDFVSDPPAAYKTDIWLIESTRVMPLTATPIPTQVVIFPLVKQDGEGSVSPQNLQVLTTTPEISETPTPTLTPTFIPPQDLSTNVPIVFGAMVIVVVIVGAWFFVSRSELRSSQEL